MWTGPVASHTAVHRCLLRQAGYAIAAGVDMLQIRERDVPGAELAALVSEVVTLAKDTVTRVIVNDRLDVALACGAAGVHLRSDSVPPEVVRASVPAGFLIGRSVRDVLEATAAAPYVDYLLAGTVWPSESKPDLPVLLGTDGLSAIARAVRVPVLAIGGVTASRLREVAACGAAGVAAIGLFLAPEGGTPGCRAIPLAAVAELVRATAGSTGYH